MRKYLTMLLVLALITTLAGCGGDHKHSPSEASKFSDDTRVK